MRPVVVTARVEISQEFDCAQSGATIGEVVQLHMLTIQDQYGKGVIDRITISGLRGLQVVDHTHKKAR